MNINSASTKNYEMNSLAGADKTKPILPAVGVSGLPGLKRQLSRIRPHSRGPVLSLPAVSAVEPSKDNSPNLKSEICDLKSRLRLTPGPRIQTHPYSLLLTPYSFFCCNFSHFETLSNTYSSAIPPLFLSFSKLFTL